MPSERSTAWNELAAGEDAERRGHDEERVRRDFRAKAKQVAATLPSPRICSPPITAPSTVPRRCR